MPGLTLITEPEQATLEWLCMALGARTDADPATQVSSKAIGTGLMGRSYRLTFDSPLDTASGQIRSVVMKCPSADTATRQMGASAYQREIGFYQEVAAGIDANLPKCYHANISANGEDFVLILEDITPAQQGNQLTGCSIEEARQALRNLARFHASTWEMASLGDKPWLQTSGTSLADIYPLVLNGFRERFADLVAPDVWPVLDAFAKGQQQWFDSEPSTRSGVHGDYRLDNLLFRPNGAAVAVDWQTVSYANPGRDLGYFLGNSLTTELRREAEDELVAYYCDCLNEAGVIYSEASAQADLRHGAFQGPLVTTIGAFTASRSDRSEPMFAAMIDRSVAQIIDHDSLSLIT